MKYNHAKDPFLDSDDRRCAMAEQDSLLKYCETW